MTKEKDRPPADPKPVVCDGPCRVKRPEIDVLCEAHARTQTADALERISGFLEEIRNVAVDFHGAKFNR